MFKGLLFLVLLYCLQSIQYVKSTNIIDASITTVDGYLDLTNFWTHASLVETQATTTTNVIPNGCECKAVGTSPCVHFDCLCTCDVTAGACDVNCCCDTECSEIEISQFEKNDACLPTGATTNTDNTCLDNSDVTVNVKRGMTTTTPGLDNMVCVVIDNNPSKGIFIDNIGAQSELSYSKQGILPEYRFSPSIVVQPLSPLSELYSYGSNIVAAVLTDSTLVSVFGGYVPIARQDIDGSCSEGSFIEYLKNESNECNRYITYNNLQEMCGAYMNIEYMLTSVRYGKFPTTSGNLADMDTFIKPTIRQVTVVDTVLNIQSVYVSGVDISISETGVSQNGTSLPTLETLFTSNTVTECSICENSIIGTEYTLQHNSEGLLETVLVDVTVAKVLERCSNSSSSVQSVSSTIRFTPTTAVTLPTGNTIPRDKSGNPGYVIGKPVLVGSIQSDGVGVLEKQAIQLKADGLTLSGPGTGGDCDTSMSIQVLFGQDTLTSCSISLTAAELETMCVDSIPSILNVTDTHVGVYGSSDPLDVLEWLKIHAPSGDSVTSGATWNEISQSCSDLVTEIHYEFLTGFVGEETNPQETILALRVRYGLSSWKMRVPGSTTVNPTGSSQTYSYKSTVTFIRLPNRGLDEYVPPLPKLIPELPHDILYPFNLPWNGSSSTSMMNSSIRVNVLLLLCLSFVAVILFY